MDNIFLQLILTVGSIFLGFFALVKYFLKHLELKNGHMERIANKFNDTVIYHFSKNTEVSAKLTSSNKALGKAVDRLAERMK